MTTAKTQFLQVSDRALTKLSAITLPAALPITIGAGLLTHYLPIGVVIVLAIVGLIGTHFGWWRLHTAQIGAAAIGFVLGYEFPGLLLAIIIGTVVIFAAHLIAARR
jgi:hypothetical protein